MAQVVARDQPAFARLVARHLDSVHRYLTRLTRSPADADELSQETFLRLWQRADSFRPGTARLTTWLHRIAHNLAVDAMRRRPATVDVPAPQLQEMIDGMVDPAADPEVLAASERRGQRLEAAIAALPPNQRAALLLCQVQGFANRDAAAILGVSVRSLESLIARARRSLRQAVAEADAPPAAAPRPEGTDHDTA